MDVCFCFCGSCRGTTVFSFVFRLSFGDADSLLRARALPWVWLRRFDGNLWFIHSAVCCTLATRKYKSSKRNRFPAASSMTATAMVSRTGTSPYTCTPIYTCTHTYVYEYAHTHILTFTHIQQCILDSRTPPPGPGLTTELLWSWKTCHAAAEDFDFHPNPQI